ncbi:MAG: hypothetical protein HYU86_11130 [Chloroflexi bacterium]|nr:hypothetical protein [Chloroflexota bacterium]
MTYLIDDDLVVSGQSWFKQGTSPPASTAHLSVGGVPPSGQAALYGYRQPSGVATAYGVYGVAETPSGSATQWSVGVYGEGRGNYFNTVGVRGVSQGNYGAYGVHGEAINGMQAYGVWGRARSGAVGAKNYSLYAAAPIGGDEHYGVYAEAPSGGVVNWSGYFAGDVYIGGKVGIGTTSPGLPLTINKAYPQLRLTHPGGLTADIGIGTGSLDIVSDSNLVMRIYGSGGATGKLSIDTGLRVGDSSVGEPSNPLEVYGISGEVLRVTSGGYVGVGITNPQAKLHVAGDVRLDGDLIVGSTYLKRPDGAQALALLGGDSIDGGAYFNAYGLFHATAPGQAEVVFSGANARFKVFNKQAAYTEVMSMDASGNLTIPGNLTAANNIKVWDSGWFDVAALGTYNLTHTLGVVPNLIQLFFRASSASSHFMVLEAFLWGEQPTEYGAYVRAITSTALQVVVRNKIGLNDAGNDWVTSGQAKVVAWA